jgi:hypothetical protein
LLEGAVEGTSDIVSSEVSTGEEDVEDEEEEEEDDEEVSEEEVEVESEVDETGVKQTIERKDNRLATEGVSVRGVDGAIETRKFRRDLRGARDSTLETGRLGKIGLGLTTGVYKRRGGIRESNRDNKPSNCFPEKIQREK